MPLEQQSRPGEETVYFFQQSPAVIKSSSLEELLQKPEECCFISVENEDYDGSAVGLPVTFSDEKWKTVQAFLFLLAGLSVSALALAGVHDRQPITSPLPDIVFTYFNQVDNGLEMSEYLILLVTYSTFTTMLFHHHRWIIFRRVFVVAGLLYLGRGVTMFVTVLPQANLYYPCAAKMNNTNPLLIARRAVSLLSGLGLSINGKLVYCGDFIYSGHTCSLVLCSLVFAECKILLSHTCFGA
ncbi:phosphatidylcholine:ceramide cholinephosphotransferase 1-like isoform X2 [Paramacrobiotus metropolitanus]|uniref:phosphatidylcholine:ceramide cholinephosphotransferase 1-like isoform X2 n=1 Tax=Paramacrobiotus metropolitanus TaxID=2943436 RepID=UPI002445B3BA|nr:phosphatidylcholine:ceramide cholinephosphotransferase 1-like isoform X2 [Paramacrobiotus metropolitanus]